MSGQLSLLGEAPTVTRRVPTRATIASAYGTSMGRVMAAEKRAMRAADAPTTPTETRLRTEIALLHEMLAHSLECEVKSGCPWCTAGLASLQKHARTAEIIEEHEAVVESRRLAKRLAYAEELERAAVALLRTFLATRRGPVSQTTWEALRTVSTTIESNGGGGW